MVLSEETFFEDIHIILKSFFVLKNKKNAFRILEAPEDICIFRASSDGCLQPPGCWHLTQVTQIGRNSAYISNQYDVGSSPEACCNVSFVSLARLNCVCTFIRRLFIGKLNMVEWQRIPTLVDFNRVGCVTSCEINRAETNRQADTNGDLCCQSVTSKLLFLLCYTFHPTCNLIGKSLTRWNCLSCPLFFPSF